MSEPAHGSPRSGRLVGLLTGTWPAAEQRPTARDSAADDRTARDPTASSMGFEEACTGLGRAELLEEARALERFRRATDNLYQRVRALLFLHALYRYRLADPASTRPAGALPVEAHTRLLHRRFDESIAILSAADAGPAVESALAQAYRALAFQTLADQVRQSVERFPGNRWMSEVRAAGEHPLRVHPALGERVLVERTPVRMDLSHSGWSDIFFLAMDAPEAARVLNVSIDLALCKDGVDPQPPVEAAVRVLRGEPFLRLRSLDLGVAREYHDADELFEFARDHLGLLKAAVIAAGWVPIALEGHGARLADVLGRVVGVGHGLELTTCVHGIPKGSRLAVSTTLLASAICVLMRATGQVRFLEGSLSEEERRQVCARALLGEWLGGSGGGWQDSGGLWPGLKLLTGAAARAGDPEFGISRGCLLPQHERLDGAPLANGGVPTRAMVELERSLVLVHGGMAQDVGPILEMVTERYLLRSPAERAGRATAAATFDEILRALRCGDVAALGRATHQNFFGPIRSLLPQASSPFTERLVERVQDEFGESFLGFWMLGGMSGGGMGFLFAPGRRAEAEVRLGELLRSTRREFETRLTFSMEPVVYAFRVNRRGTWAELAECPPAQPVVPVPASTGESLEELLQGHGFDRHHHEFLRAELLAGRLGLARNRLPQGTQIEDVRQGDVTRAEDADSACRRRGEDALRAGAVAVVTLAGGAGSRWTGGGSVVKALAPVARLGGRFRSFLEIQRAKSTRLGLPHIVTASYLTHAALEGSPEVGRGAQAAILARGRSIGLRFVPTAVDLRFLWRASVQQRLDVRAQKVRASLERAWLDWTDEVGPTSDYRDNEPERCVHPLGHAWELPHLLLNGVLQRLISERPALTTLFVHNVDTLGASVDPSLLGLHLDATAALSFEVVPRTVEDAGGGLARVDGRLRLVEGLALPRDDDELGLSYYNSLTTWVDIDGWLALLGLTRSDLSDPAHVSRAVEAHLARLPCYVAIRHVKRVWGRAQEDVFPVAQVEQLWGDVSALPEARVRYFAVPRRRGGQLKEPAQLDGWLRDGSASYVEKLCGWT